MNEQSRANDALNFAKFVRLSVWVSGAAFFGLILGVAAQTTSINGALFLVWLFSTLGVFFLSMIWTIQFGGLGDDRAKSLRSQMLLLMASSLLVFIGGAILAVVGIAVSGLFNSI